MLCSTPEFDKKTTEAYLKKKSLNIKKLSNILLSNMQVKEETLRGTKKTLS